MSLIVTGASGELGRRTAELLFERVDPSEVVLVTRSPDALAESAARGATVRFGDFDDAASLAAAFAGGADRMLLISTHVIGTREEGHGRAIDAAVAAGVRHVAYTSFTNPSVTENPAFIVREHAETEAALRASGLAWTFLRNALYSEYEFPAATASIASGQFVTNRGSGASPFVSREDCAAVAAAWLAGVPGSEGVAYDVTGPSLITPADEAAAFAEVSGRPVSLVEVDDEAWASGLAAAAGMPVEAARGFATVGRAIREGAIAVASTAVQDLTGRAPRSFGEVLAAAREEIVPAV